MIDNKKDELKNEVIQTIESLNADTLTGKYENGSNELGILVSFDALKEVSIENAKFYENEENECGQRYHGAFTGIIDHVEVARKLIDEIQSFVHEYDFDEHTPGNGYRSFIKATRQCVEHSVKVSKHIAQNRTFIWFRKNMYMK